MTQIDNVLAERGARYGDFSDHAAVCQKIKMAFLYGPSKWNSLSDVQKQALEVIADKIARILSGDPNYDDNWIDIQGYAKLAQDRLIPQGGGEVVPTDKHGRVHGEVTTLLPRQYPRGVLS